jgi:hypothetical protein
MEERGDPVVVVVVVVVVVRVVVVGVIEEGVDVVVGVVSVCVMGPFGRISSRVLKRISSQFLYFFFHVSINYEIIFFE